MAKSKEMIESIEKTVNQISSFVEDLKIYDFTEPKGHIYKDFELALMAIKHELMFTRDKVERYMNSAINNNGSYSMTHEIKKKTLR